MRPDHTVFHHRYHIVWVTKYRYKFWKELCVNEYELVSGVLSREHVHMFVEIPPHIAVIGDESDSLISRFAWLVKLFAISPEQGAETIVYLASSPAVAETTGKYFYKRQSVAPSPVAQDDRAATLLWERSLKSCQIDGR